MKKLKNNLILKQKKRDFKSQACHFSNDSDKTNIQCQADIQCKAQEKNMEDIENQRKSFAKVLNDSLISEAKRLNRIDKDVFKLKNKSHDERTEVVDQLDQFNESLTVSQETIDKLVKSNEKYDKLEKSCWDKLGSLNSNIGDESVKSQHVLKGLVDTGFYRTKNQINVLLDDNSLNDEQKSRLQNLKDQLKKCNQEDTRVSEHAVELAKSWRDLDKSFDKLESDYPELSQSLSEPKSNLDDYADVSTEMPSYMDPED